MMWPFRKGNNNSSTVPDLRGEGTWGNCPGHPHPRGHPQQ